MAITHEQAVALRDEVKEQHRTRHDAFRILRRCWHGNYWDISSEGANDITQVFRDLTSNSSVLGPDFKFVHNIVQQVALKYQIFLSPLPQVRVYADPPETELRRRQATTKQRYIYGCWAAGQMDRKFGNMGWYLPLMGQCYLGIFPDFERKLPVPLLRSPEYAFPVPGFDGNTEEAIIFSWKVRESAVARKYPDYVRRDDRPKGVIRQVASGLYKTARESDPGIEMLEYSDKNCFQRWADGQLLNGVEHDYGFNFWEPVKFIDVPDEPWGHGAVEQSIGLNVGENILYSLMMQAVFDGVFPRLILENPQKFPEEIDAGAGAVIGVNEGGKAYFLQTPGNAFAEGFANMNEHNIRRAGGLNEVDFGQSPASSIVTGKSIEALQGGGTGSTVEMVQGTGIGAAVVRWNEKAIYIGQKAFRSDKVNLFGTEINPTAINPRQFAISMKGSELVGSSRNDVTFAPYYNLHEKVVIGLQMAGGGLVSKKYQREQAGITDSEAMDEEMFAEAAEEAVLGFFMQQLQAEASPETATRVEEQAVAYLSGAPAPAALPPGQAPAAGLPGAGLPPPLAAQPQPAGPPLPGLPGQGQLPIPGQGAPAAGPPSGPAPPPPQASPASQGVTLDEAIAAFQGVTGITGKVYLVGEIVQVGKTSDEIEVAVTKQADEQTLRDALTQYAGQLVFHLVRGEPSEPHVEVTPGATPTPSPGQAVPA